MDGAAEAGAAAASAGADDGLLQPVAKQSTGMRIAKERMGAIYQNRQVRIKAAANQQVDW
jgi:hypothetical protein